VSAKFESNGNISIGFEYSNGNWSNLSTAKFDPELQLNNPTFGAKGEIGIYPLDIDATVRPYYQPFIEAKFGAKIGFVNSLSINNQSLTNKIDAKVIAYGEVGADFKKWLGVDSEFSLIGEVVSINLLNQTIPFTIPTDGLVAYYPFNGNANDDSGYDNQGALNNITFVTDRHGNATGAPKFGGYNSPSYIKVSNSPSLKLEDSFTFSAYVILNDLRGMGSWGNYETYGNHTILAKDHDRTGIALICSGKENEFVSRFKNNSASNLLYKTVEGIQCDAANS